MKRFFQWALVAVTLLSINQPDSLFARTSSASANTFSLALDPYSYITINGSQTMQPWRYHFGLFLNYAHRPLEVGVGGVRRQGIIDHLIMGDVFGVLGITDWFQVGLDVPVAIYEDWTNPTTGVREKTLRMSDVRLETKFRLLDYDRYPVGIAVMPYVLFPTGAGSRFVGNNRFAGGGKLVVDTNIKNLVEISTNLGVMARDKVTILTTEIGTQFTYGLGIKVKPVNWLDIMADTYGTTNVSNFFKRQAETPLEVDGGLRFHLPKPEGLAITAGGGAGLTFGYGSPDIRGFVGVSYPNPTRYDLPAPPPPPPPEPMARIEKEKIVITKKVHFEFDKAVIRPISFQILDAVIDILKQNSDLRKVRVEGHCDYKGSVPYNMKLSQRRANAVRDYLIAHGIEGDRLVAKGYGKSRPIADNKTAEGRARNRRVEFIIVDQEGVAPETAPQ